MLINFGAFNSSKNRVLSHWVDSAFFSGFERGNGQSILQRGEVEVFSPICDIEFATSDSIVESEKSLVFRDLFLKNKADELKNQVFMEYERNHSPQLKNIYERLRAMSDLESEINFQKLKHLKLY